MQARRSHSQEVPWVSQRCGVISAQIDRKLSPVAPEPPPVATPFSRTQPPKMTRQSLLNLLSASTQLHDADESLLDVNR
jgi:hypothetical protein